METNKEIQYLALGDSYTIGEAVASSERWPQYLVTKLRADSLEISDPQIIAKTGWTTDELKEAILEIKPHSDFDLVSLLIGVNNQYREYDIDVYKKEFEELLLMAIQFAKGDASRVFVVSIPDYGVTPFAASKNPEKIAMELDKYNAINKEISQKHQVAWFDITSISRLAEQDQSMTAEDNLHPSGKMYAQWVRSFFDQVKLLVSD